MCLIIQSQLFNKNNKLKISLQIDQKMIQKQKMNDNMEIIAKKQQQFKFFLTNIVKKQNFKEQNDKKEKYANYYQNSPSKDQITQKCLDWRYNRQEKKIEKNQKRAFRCRYQQGEPNFAIRSLDKINLNSSKIFQEQNIKKFNSTNQIIQIKSVNNLPPWLFQHIRKKNIQKLKNFYVHKQQNYSLNPSQSSSAYDNQHSTENLKNNSKQRIFNSSFVSKNNDNRTDKQMKYNKNQMFQKDQEIKKVSNFENISSSYQMRSKDKFKITKNNMKNRPYRLRKNEYNPEDIYFSEFDYNYNPEKQIYGKQKEQRMKNQKRKISAQKHHKMNNRDLKQEGSIKQRFNINDLNVNSVESRKPHLKNKFIRQQTFSQEQPLNTHKLHSFY